MRSLALDRRTLLAAGAAVLLGLTGCGSDAASAIDQVGSPVPRRTASPAALGPAVAAVQHLAGELYGELSTSAGNLAFSPFSVAVALAMAVNGAAGRTRTQMLDVLGSHDVGGLDQGMNGLLAHLESLAVDRKEGDEHLRVAVDIADAIFAQRGYPYERPFLDALARDYGAGLETVDFIGAADAACEEINAWTSDHTAGLIHELLAPDALDSDTRLVLVNALHVLASWETEFDDPRDAPFRLESGGTVAVPMMSGGAASGHRRGDGWESVQLPYRGADAPGLAMTVILPDAGRLAEVEALVRRQGLAAFLPATGAVAVTMPAWSVTTSVSLAGVLRALGMTDAFGDRADFSRITTADPLVIADVVHQAVVRVDQHGTEAAAATAVTFAVSGSAAPSHEVVVDRPYLFVVHDLDHGTPLFVGRVVDPRQR